MESAFALQHDFNRWSLYLMPQNAAILVPKYLAFLEGLVEIIMNLPAGFYHITSKLKHEVFISYLMMYRVKYDPDQSDAPAPGS
ncbi:hypothetical protein EW146_g690 [Bondarzewia mesenterica]|uniref:Uncharacterized protein n=1 Tax=Bondarzewia mesenterica TaxID=1095465 RepID=A0A4V3XGB4_9AGAM|nr:hypothetical protein EW146_g690 [Bondarzewia mesenterica]